MEPLKIQQKWEDMIQYAYVILRSFPKSERFTLGFEIRSVLWKGYARIIRANSVWSKLPELDALDIEIKVLTAMIRSAATLKILPIKKYDRISAMLVEIGKMLGGWKKSCKK